MVMSTWASRIGLLEESTKAVHELVRARRLPCLNISLFARVRFLHVQSGPYSNPSRALWPWESEDASLALAERELPGPKYEHTLHKT